MIPVWQLLNFTQDWATLRSQAYISEVLMRTILAASALLLASALLARAEDQGWSEISLDDLKVAIKDGKTVLFDNNPKFVWEERRLPGAKWLHAQKYEASDLPADKDTPLVFYCMNDN